MKKLRYVTIALVLGGSLATRSAWSQTGTTSTTERVTTSRVLSPEPIAPLPLTDFSSTTIKRPERQERALPPDIRELLKRFESSREAYIKRETELKESLKGAAEADRKAIRTRISAMREKWLEQSKQFRDEARQRVRDLKRELPSHREALDETRPALQDDRRKRPRSD